MKKQRFSAAISFILIIMLVFSLTVPAFAKENKTDYPFVYVHGMCGWGEGSAEEEKTPYWGGSPDTNAITHLRSQGYTVYNPALGAYSSAWDRTCELFAKLTGTVVDYGEAHSKEFGHERFGRDYTGKATMGKAWNLESPLNFVGHSFGGETIRLLASLLAYGDETEMNADKENCSELFKGGHEKGIHSITTLSSPHNGSTVANYLSDTIVPAFLLIFVLRAASITKIYNTDLMLDQWGITVDPSSGEKGKLDPKKCMKFALAMDHCGYDLTVQGAEKLNEKIKPVKTAYYFSYSACVTEDAKFGYTKANKDYNVFLPFRFSSPIVSASVNVVLGGKFIDKSWGANDGIVPLKSALYPFDEEFVTYDETKAVVPGVWHVMPTIYGADHFDFCNAKDKKAFASYGGYLNFYSDITKLICEI